MTDDADLRDWLKWITGGIIAFIVLIWQWVERKVERVNDRVEKLRDDTRDDRHKLVDEKIDPVIAELRKEGLDHEKRIAALERDGG